MLSPQNGSAKCPTRQPGGAALEAVLAGGHPYLTPRAAVFSELSRRLPTRPKTTALAGLLEAAGFRRFSRHVKFDDNRVESVWVRGWDPRSSADLHAEFGILRPVPKAPSIAGLDKPPLERVLEQWLVEEVARRRGVTFKLDPYVTKGAPDRVVLLPGGAVLFLELKRVGRAPSPAQEYQLKRIRDAEGNGHWVSAKHELLALLDAHMDVLA